MSAGQIDVEAHVVALIPALRRSARLEQCITSILDSPGDHEIRVVCIINGGDGRRAPAVEGRATFVETGVNLGWAGGLEFGRQRARARFLWAVQDDMVLLPGSLDALLAALQADSGLGAVRPVVVDRSGRVRRRSGAVYLDESGHPQRGWPMRARSAASARIPTDATYVVGSGMLVRAEAWDAAGGWDWHYYPVQYADADFNARLRAAGWRVNLVREARALHESSASSPRQFRELLSFHNGRRYRSRWVESSTDDEPDAVVHPHPDVSREQLAAMLSASNSALFDVDAWLATRRFPQRVLRRARGLYWTLRSCVDPRI